MNRPTRPSTSRRFALRPLPLALAIAMTSAALNARAGSFTDVQQVVGAAITTPNDTTTHINQSGHNAYIQAGGFNIAAPDSVKVFQPGSTSNLLIQVTGYDPSAILGQLQANGRVFLSNPNGVLFGAGARIDVGSLVATNLSMNADEFMSGRIRLIDKGTSLGSVVNAGSIRADGTVALVGTDVTNSGSIEAARVGLAALSEVVVDVEGDGLIFFQMSGERASAKLQQLGSITADGGLVELRAQARGAAADTVLNMSGMIQARSMGSRNGQVIIDGGASGITKVTGSIDVQGLAEGETGGTVKVLGDRVALGDTALIDASGQAGGGTVLIGGNYQGGGSERRASHTRVLEGATIKANALGNGNGGTVVLWADGSTAFHGLIEAKGGALGGNGGMVEVSGKQYLGFGGLVDASAAHGALGTLLLDPANIYVVADGAPQSGTTIENTFTNLDNSPTDTPGDFSVEASAINASNADITLAATNNITVNSAITRGAAGAGKSLTLTAGNDIIVNAAITTNNGNLTLRANNDSSGGGAITLGANLNAGTASVDLNGAVSLAADVSITAGTHIKFFSTVDSADNTTARKLTLTADEIEVTGRMGGNFVLSDLTLATNDLILTNTNAIGVAAGAIARITNKVANGNIFIQTGSGTATQLYLNPTSDLARFSNFTQLQIGAASGSGNITQDGVWDLPTNVLLQSGSGTIDLKSNIDATVAGAQGLTLSTSGTVNIGDDGTAEHYGATRELSGLTVTAGTINFYAASVSTTQDQSYTGNIVLQDFTGADQHTLTGRSLTLGAITSAEAGRSLTLTATESGGLGGTVTLNGSIGNTVSSSQGIAALTIDSSSTTTLGSSATNITTSGDQTYKGGVTATAATTTIRSTAGNVTFEKTLDADTSTRNVTVDATGTGKATTFGGNVSGLGSLTTTGATTVNADIGAATLISFGGTTTLGTGTAATTRTLDAATVTLNGLATGVKNVAIKADTLTLNGTVTSTNSQATVSTHTDGRTISLETTATAATTDLDITSATLAKFSQFAGLTIGRSTSNSAITTTTGITLPTATTLVSGSGNIALSTVTGAGFNLAANTTGTVAFNGNVSNVGSLTTTGATSVNANLSANTLISFGGTTTLVDGTASTTRTLDAATVTLADVATGVKNIVIKADTLNLNGTLTSSGSQATLATHTDDRAISLETAATAATTDLDITSATLAKFGQFGGLTIGRNDSDSAITSTSGLTLPTNLTLVGGSSNIALSTVTGAGFDLAANTTGTVTFNDDVAGVNELTTTGAVTVNADISATTLISLGGTTTLGTGTAATTRTLDAATVTLNGLATGVKNIAIKADTLTLNGTVTSTGSQATVSTHTDGRTISLETTATAATTDLDITSATLAKFSQFAGLTIGRSTSNSAITTTTGITLPTATTLVSGSGNIALSTVTGAGFNLAANTTGTVAFNGNVSNVGSLTTTGATSVNANLSANTLISFGGTTTLVDGTASTTRTLDAATVTLADVATGVKNIVIKADTLNLNGTLTSSGSQATLATHTDGRAISLESAGTVATTDLDITSATLAKFGQFGGLTIGRSDSNSVISTTTAIALPTATTLLTGSTGTISLAAVTGNGFGLTLTAGGDTALTGAFTNVAALTSNGGGRTVISTDLATTTSMNFAGGENVVLAGGGTALTLRSGAITLSGNLDAAGKNVTLRADSLALSGTISNAGSNATLLSDTLGLIRVGTTGSGSALDISTALLGKFSGFGQLNIGSTGINADVLTGAITLPTHTTFASGGGSITLGAITGAGFDLTTNSVGNTVTLQGDVAGVRDLTTTGTATGIVIDTASVSTTRKQSYNANITLGTGSGARALSAPTIEITGSHTITAGAHDLSLHVDTLTMAGAITGSTGSDLTLATFTASKTIGVLGGAGDLQIDNTLLSQLSGFDSITIGRSDSTAAGTITLGDGTASVVSLPLHLRLLSGAADIQVLNAIDSAGGTLGITSTTGDVLIAQDLGSGGNNLASLSITTGGETTLQGVSIYADSATFDSNVVLATNSTSGSAITYLNGGTYTFEKDIRGTGTGVESLYAYSAALTRLRGDVGVASATRLLNLYTADAEVGGQLFTTGFVALYGSTTLTGDTRIETATTYLGSNGSTHTFNAATHDLSILTSQLNVNLGSVSGGDQLTLAPLLAGDQIRISTTGAASNVLLIAPSLLSQWGSFSHITIGSANTGNITLDHSSATTLGTDTTLLSGSGNILISSALQGGHALTLDASSGLTLVQADLGSSGSALGSLIIVGETEFAGGSSAVTVRTSGDQDYQDKVKLANATTLRTSAGNVRLRDTVDAKAGASATADLTIDTTGGNARFDAAVGTTTALNSLTTNAALINTDSITTVGAQTYHGNVTLSSASTTLKGSTITADGTINGSTPDDQALVLDGNAVLKGAVGATGLRLASLQVNGTSALSGGNIFTDGAQTYTGAVTLGANTTLTSTNGDVVFSSSINGDTAASRSLTVNTQGLTRFLGAVGGTASLASLTTDADGSTELAAAITTSGAQTYNDEVDVNGTATLTAGGRVDFNAAVNGKTAGAGALSINTALETRFASTVGATRALGSLATNTGGSTTLLGNVTTTGAISLQDAVTLGANLTITHGGLLTFGGTVDGAHALTLDGGVGNAAVAFSGAVGGTTALTSLTTVGTGSASFLAGASGATTTGAQQYGGNVVLTGNNKAFTGSSLDVDGSLTGANGLTLTTNALSLGTTLSGTGALLIQTLSTGTTIGVGTGASGTLQIAQNLLNGTAGFSSLVIGRTDGSGSINVGAANLGTHTTLRSGTGAIALNGAVNSLSGTPVDLSLQTGGAITLAADLGSTNALRDIITSHAVSTPNAISIGASRILLDSLTGVRINNLTLTGAGSSLIQTAQRLVLEGTISLSGGGTLGLVSTMAPTKVDVTDSEYAGNNSLTVGLVGSLREASAGVDQTSGKILTAAGTTLYVRTTQGASINLAQADNDIQGSISAVSGRIGESATSTRLTTPDGSGEFNVGFVRIASKQINVLGQPVNDADQSLIAAGIEGDAVVLSADKINTSANNGLIRARLPYDNNQGTLTALPGLTLLLSPTGLNGSQAYGGVLEADRIQVSVGNASGGYITVRPKGGASLGPGFVSLGGNTSLRPFYDGSGKVTEVPVFYNGDVPQTPQEVGALSAVIAVIEESRRQRFEEAVRTENVSARLRSGVIAEVGAGRPATEGSDSIRMPASCTPAGESLSCQ